MFCVAHTRTHAKWRAQQHPIASFSFISSIPFFFFGSSFPFFSVDTIDSIFLCRTKSSDGFCVAKRYPFAHSSTLRMTFACRFSIDCVYKQRRVIRTKQTPCIGQCDGMTNRREMQKKKGKQEKCVQFCVLNWRQANHFTCGWMNANDTTSFRYIYARRMEFPFSATTNTIRSQLAELKCYAMMMRFHRSSNFELSSISNVRNGPQQRHQSQSMAMHFAARFFSLRSRK